MRRPSLFAPVLILSLAFFSPVLAVNGFIEDVEGQNVMHVWGTHYEMGYANGYLNGVGIQAMVEDYTIDKYIGPVLYVLLRATAAQYIEIPSPFDEEFQGIIDGMEAAGVDMYIESLSRNTDILDIEILNAAPESNRQLACSSLSGWGQATMKDPALLGNTVLCRDLDWTPDSGGVLYNNMLITTYESSVPGEQPWVSVGFSGIIGCLSGFNGNGIGAFLNMGNHADKSAMPGDEGLVGEFIRDGGVKVVPELLALRAGMESNDFDGDGENTIADIYVAASTFRRGGTYCIHVVSPWTGCLLPVPAGIIEAHYSAGVAPRFSVDDEDLTPFLLAVTNHHRILFPPVYCYRYNIIKDSLMEDFRLTGREAWEIESAVANSTLQTMLFRPDYMDIRISFAVPGTQAPFIQPVVHKWDNLFPGD